ncbi:MAG TPA: hypothetical protein VJR25_09280 [Microbacterium sp.]|uniref:hypothetical protein n=1 Tax=Microbacterium sp. TaxID=51671 RepID=UPI002B485207|nr:hypothetical protein [Microbacterium sp.]HKT56952.1 hypothetical protein [Microbacterium sp.]
MTAPTSTTRRATANYTTLRGTTHPGCLGGTANTLWDGFGGIALYGILIAVPALALLIVGLSVAIRVGAGKPVSTILWPLCWAAGISTVAYVVLAGMFFQV